MDDFNWDSNRHFYLYAKGHYQRKCIATELIKIQSKRCGVQESSITLRDVNITLIDLAHKHMKNKYIFRCFIDSINTYTNQSGMGLAISKACLSVFANAKKSEVGFDLGEPNPNVLPLENRPRRDGL